MITLSWNALRVVITALSLIALTRLLDVHGYGTLVGALALFAALGHFVGAGTGIALVRSVSRAPDQQHHKLKTTQLAYLTTGVGVFLFAWPLSTWLLSDELSATALFYLAFAELVAAPSLQPHAYRFQSLEKLAAFGAYLTLGPAVRLVCAAVALAIDVSDLDSFALLYCAGLALTALAVNLPSVRVREPPQSRFALLPALKEGFPYMLGNAFASAGAELDKTIVLKLAGAAPAGQYAAAYRLMQAAVLPVNSLVMAAIARLFRASGQASSAPSIRHLLAASTIYASAAAFGMWVCAPLVPWLLGARFAASTELLRALCPVLVLVCSRQVLMAILTTRDMQAIRNYLDGAALGLSLTLLLILVPRYSAMGAVVAIGVVELLVVASSILILRPGVWRRTAAKPGPGP